MEYGKIDEPHFVVCLEGGDEIHDSLVAFVEKEHITFGMIQGIGTVREVTLGFFQVLCQMLGCPTTKSPFRNSARHLPSSFFANSHRESGS